MTLYLVGESESVSGRAEAHRISGWSLVLTAVLAECGLVWLLDRFAGSPVDCRFGVPYRAVWSPPGGDTTSGHRQSPAAFMNEVVMSFT